MQLRHLGRRLGRRGGLGATLQTPNGTVSWAAPSLFGAPSLWQDQAEEKAARGERRERLSPEGRAREEQRRGAERLERGRFPNPRRVSAAARHLG